MRTLVFTILLVLFPIVAAAQVPVGTPAPTQHSATQLTDGERLAVRKAVVDVRDAHRRSRTGAGISYIVGGLLVGGLGMYLYLSQDDPVFRLIGVAIAFSAVPQLVAGMWNIFYNTAQEDIATKILTRDELVDGGGLLFVEQEARRAKRDRLVGGSTSIVAGAATLGSYFLLREFIITGPDNILLIFFSVAAVLQVLQGVISLASKSGAERAYSDLLSRLGRDPTAPPTPSADPARISRLRFSPALYGNEGRLAPGLGLSFGF